MWYGMEYDVGQFGSAVQTVAFLNFLPTSSLLTEGCGEGESPGAVQVLLYSIAIPARPSTPTFVI